MYKRLAVSAALLLLLSSLATANLQTQGYGLGGTNTVGVLGDGVAGNIKVTTTALDQLQTGPGHVVGYQGTAGALTQAAGASGMNTWAGVIQNGSAGSVQQQLPGTGFQVQDLGANLVQDVKQIGGAGSALGLQTFVGVQTQLSFNPWGGSANVQGIGVSLYDAVGSTGGGGLTSVTGGANFSAGQL